MSSSNINISFESGMKKKGYFKHEEVEGEEMRTHYYRFVHPWYRVRKMTRQSNKAPLSKERIVDRHNGLEHSVVVTQPYAPESVPEATFRTGEEFWNAVTASRTRKQTQGEHIMCANRVCTYSESKTF